ncbi:hypothetical protein CRYUN_Cryun18bG0063200 [Craigia yunnanensis]
MTDVQKWTAPQEGTIKVNFDGAIKAKDAICEIGVVSKDWNAAVLGALQTPVKDFVDPSGIEAFAAFRALDFAKEMGFMHDIAGMGCSGDYELNQLSFT